MERFASSTGLLPEQIWDEADRPRCRLYLGRPTGSAMPLAWAHAEYVKLLRSRRDGRVFDRVPEAAARYCGASPPSPLEIWKRNRKPASVPAGWTLRVMGTEAFDLRYTVNAWRRFEDRRSSPTSLGVHFVDLAVPPDQEAPIEFTFRWLPGGRWEGRNYRVRVTKNKAAA
jgi:glucoamylase